MGIFQIVNEIADQARALKGYINEDTIPPEAQVKCCANGCPSCGDRGWILKERVGSEII